MADCSQQFLALADRLDFRYESRSTLDRMRASKGQVEIAIKAHLLGNKVSTPPSFKLQGSYKLGTLVRSEPGVPVDIDLGVHLDLGDSVDSWPRPTTVLGWISDAILLGTRASSVPIKKKRCVRLEYAGDYHIDVPVYARGTTWLGNPKCYLADGGSNEWVESDPRAFEKWFLEAGGVDGSPLVRTVRALKCWTYNRFTVSKPQPPSGFLLTVLAGLHAGRNTEADDARIATLFGDLKTTLDGLLLSSIYNPVNSGEDLLEPLSERQLSTFKQELQLAEEISQRALDARSTEQACQHWQRLFGYRFPSN